MEGHSKLIVHFYDIRGDRHDNFCHTIPFFNQNKRSAIGGRQNIWTRWLPIMDDLMATYYLWYVYPVNSFLDHVSSTTKIYN